MTTSSSNGLFKSKLSSLKPLRTALSGSSSKPTISLILDEPAVFVSPSQDSEEEEEHQLVTGSITIQLPYKPSASSAKPDHHKPKWRRLTLSRFATADSYGGQDWLYETDDLGQDTLECDLTGCDLASEGTHHSFNFSFLIPTSTPVSQRCAYGRVRHFLKATLESNSKLNTTSSISTPQVPLWIVASPFKSGQIPEPVNLGVEVWLEELGPLALSITTPHLVPSGLISLSLFFPSPPPTVIITNIQAYISQSYEISYSGGRTARPCSRKVCMGVEEWSVTRTRARGDEDEEGRVDFSEEGGGEVGMGLEEEEEEDDEEIPTTNEAVVVEASEDEHAVVGTGAGTGRGRRPFSFGSRARTATRSLTPRPSIPPATLPAFSEPPPSMNNPFPLPLSPSNPTTVSIVARLPAPTNLRPSTLPGSKGRIKVSHVVGVEISWTVKGKEGRKEDRCRVGRGVVLGSCECHRMAQVLPSYDDLVHAPTSLSSFAPPAPPAAGSGNPGTTSPIPIPSSTNGTNSTPSVFTFSSPSSSASSNPTSLALSPTFSTLSNRTTNSALTSTTTTSTSFSALSSSPSSSGSTTTMKWMMLMMVMMMKIGVLVVCGQVGRAARGMGCATRGWEGRRGWGGGRSRPLGLWSIMLILEGFGFERDGSGGGGGRRGI
ncbi:hypothetical protein T439DRAFT_139116 [Meredithblackwellia eburnea MCA 4105]